MEGILGTLSGGLSRFCAESRTGIASGILLLDYKVTRSMRQETGRLSKPRIASRKLVQGNLKFLLPCECRRNLYEEL